MTAYLSLAEPISSPAILHEGDGFALLFKPPGMAVQPDPRGDEDLLTWYRADAAVVGRLDRPVSGLVLVATSADGRRRLQTAQSQQEIGKFYRAKLPVNAPKLPPVIEHGWRFERGRAQAVKPGAKRSKLMRTHTIKQGVDWAELQLITGRRHQLRVQLAALDCPIVGDRRYGGERAERVYLSCVGIELPNGSVFRLDPQALEALNLAD